MPQAIPVIASFAAAGSAVSAAGGIAAAMGTLSGFAAVSGAVLTGIGALTGKSSLTKVGSLLSLGGYAASSFGAASAAGLGEGITAANGFGAAAGAGETLGAAGAGMTPGSSALIADHAAQASPFALNGQVDAGLMARTKPAWAAAPVVPDSLSKLASGMSSQDVYSLLEKAMQKGGAALKGAAQFVKDNPQLSTIVASSVGNAFGPESELVDLKKDEFNYRRSLLDRQRANLNNPIRLGYGG